VFCSRKASSVRMAMGHPFYSRRNEDGSLFRIAWFRKPLPSGCPPGDGLQIVLPALTAKRPTAPRDLLELQPVAGGRPA